VLRTGVILADRYQLDEPIAAGGVGQVWRATDLVLQRPVAIKLLRPEYADHHETLSRFRAEARHAGSLAHPGIAQVYDFGDNPAEGPPYLVMELVDGPSLADVLATEPVTPAYALDVLSKAATGLAAAHEAGLVHRDIKPGNILLGRDGQVKITDFGIAHAVGSAPVTDPGLVMGTTQYLAPERIAGGSGTPAADLYSLGIVMHECLNGTPPYEGTPAEVMAGHLYVPLPPLPEGTPSEVEDLVARLTAKDPEQRLTDANELSALAAKVHTAVTGGPMPRQRQAPAASPVGGVAAPADLTDPALMPRTGDHQVPNTGDHQVPNTGDMMLDPILAAPEAGEHPYAEPPAGEPLAPAAGLAAVGLAAGAAPGVRDGEPVIGGFRVDAPAPDGPGTGTPPMGNPYEPTAAAMPPWEAPEPARETSVDMPAISEAGIDLSSISETSVDLAAVSETSVDLTSDGEARAGAGTGPGSGSAGVRTTTIDLTSVDGLGASHGTVLDGDTDPFATEGSFTGGHARPHLALGDIAGRPRGRRRAAIGIGVLLLAGGGLAGAAASGVLHASPVADRTNTNTSHQPLSAVQPNAGGTTGTSTSAKPKKTKHAKPYAPRHAKASTSAPSAAPPPTTSAPVQQQTSGGSSSSSSGSGAGSGGASPSSPSPQKPKPAPSSPPPSGLLGIPGL